jgi:hypothetical protein
MSSPAEEDRRRPIKKWRLRDLTCFGAIKVTDGIYRAELRESKGNCGMGTPQLLNATGWTGASPVKAEG